MNYKKSIYWFRQDLRVFDNKGIDLALKYSESILPIFILDENILDGFGGLEDPRFGFIREALENVDNELQARGAELLVLKGKPQDIIPKLVSQYNIQALFGCRTYDSYGKNRDRILTVDLKEMGIKSLFAHDYYLVEPEEVPTRKVFTPFFKKWVDIEKKPISANIEEIKGIKVDKFTKAKDFISKPQHDLFTLEFGKKRLEKFKFAKYEETRNNLELDGVSMLSPYLRFGVFSVREIYYATKDKSANYLFELGWREFWSHIMMNFPYTKDVEFLEKRRGISRENDEKKRQAFCNAQTGYPIVDAAITQLKTTNWMHGRARMIVASFLTKHLLIDWRRGEEFFKRYLLDYDENVNIGNWQWSASVGADARPLRIFSPILQAQRFDKNCKYIRKRIPELKKQDCKAIQDPMKYELDYITPIVIHKEAFYKAKSVYFSAKGIID